LRLKKRPNVSTQTAPGHVQIAAEKTKMRNAVLAIKNRFWNALYVWKITRHRLLIVLVVAMGYAGGALVNHMWLKNQL